jgi:feruloyl esterase
MNLRTITLAVAFSIVMFHAAPGDAATCESLMSLSLPDTRITLTQTVTAGAFTPPGANAAITNLPPFCRVAATLKPSSDSDIKMEVWLPTTNWNGKYQAVGNGGLAGSVLYEPLSDAVKRGYAASSTDTGHVGDTAKDFLGHPEKQIDFAYRAIHEMTLKAKAITGAFYGNDPRLSYFVGCSGGGRQALMEAQRYPNDFHGIVAGAPSLNQKPIVFAARMGISHAALKNPASFVPRTKYPMIHQAVVNACDAIDGLKDGLIDDPRRCSFDPKVLECKAGDSPSCLTAPQIETARKIWSPVNEPRTGREIVPQMEFGAELGWGTLASQEPLDNLTERLKYIIFKDPNYDWKTFNFPSDLSKLDGVDDPSDASNPNMSAFASQGGKLIVYHGWADQQVLPRNTVYYYDNVLEKMGGAATTAEWLRLFMVPGMAHCRGGDGPNTFDALTALEEWVEKGKAPTQIVASHSANGKVDRTRPLCPFPQVAKYKGSGSIDDAANFTCRMP